jgi:penicillin-binding protein 1A
MKVGVSTSIDYLVNKFHLSTIVTSGGHNDKNTASLALGGLTYGATPLEMTAAYATLGNGGVYSEPTYYTQVVDKYGNVVLEKNIKQSKEISEQASYVMTDILKTVVKTGTGTTASLGAQPAAGKTGTTDDHTNGWFMGYTPYYTCLYNSF